MKLKKRLMALLLIGTTMLSTNLTAFAATTEAAEGVAIQCNEILPENTDSSTEYFRFTKQNPNARMEDDGSFTFSFSWAMESQVFKPAASSIKVYATATTTSSDKTYSIYLYKSGEEDPVKKVSYKANGTSQYYEFTGLDTNSYYYLYFTKSAFNSGTVTGSGRIESIQ